MPGTSPVPDLAGVDRRVQRAHQLEDRAERRGGVQVVLHRVGERLCAPSATRAAIAGCVTGDA